MSPAMSARKAAQSLGIMCLALSLAVSSATPLYAGASAVAPDLYLRFRKNAQQEYVQPFIRFRKSLDAVQPFLRFRKSADAPYASYHFDKPVALTTLDNAEAFLR